MEDMIQWAGHGCDQECVQEFNDEYKQDRASDDNAVSDEDLSGDNVEQIQPNNHYL